MIFRLMDILIWLVSIWGCAGLFTFIGIYAGRRERPMWFWSGSQVDSETITDVIAYNKANRKMWFIYSLFYWLGGLVYFFSPLVAGVIVFLSASLGLVWLILYYRRIERKYKVK